MKQLNKKNNIHCSLKTKWTKPRLSSEVSGKKHTDMWIYNLDNRFIYKAYSSVQVLQIMCLTKV